jgi:hypothetical protein
MFPIRDEAWAILCAAVVRAQGWLRDEGWEGEERPASVCEYIHTHSMCIIWQRGRYRSNKGGSDKGLLERALGHPRRRNAQCHPRSWTLP